MTSSSGPGFTLMGEGLTALATAQLPAVIVCVSRAGPGLGRIASSQADYRLATRGGGHGDYQCLVLGPGSAQELYELTFKAFDLADDYRNPVIILSDDTLVTYHVRRIAEHYVHVELVTAAAHTVYTKDSAWVSKKL